jgi:type II secretory pathway component PulC
MNINRVRTLLVVVNVGLAAGTGYTVYKEFENKEDRRRQTQVFQEQLAAELKAAPTATRRDTTRASIKDSDLVDLTGDKPKPIEVKPVESAPTTRVLNPLKNLVKVVTISHHTDPALANVAIMKLADVQPGAERSIFRIGDVIPFANDAVVVEIHPKRVVFQNGDTLEELEVPDQITPGLGGPTGAGGSSSRAADPGNRPFATYVESKRDSWIVTIKPGGDRALEREGETVLEGVLFSTTDAPGGGKALRVDKVPPGSVLAQHGVQDGDVLISVDGVKMSTKSEVVAYAKQNKNKQVFEVVIQRKGRFVTKRVQIER